MRIFASFLLSAALLATPGVVGAQAVFSENGALFSVPVTSMRDIPFRTVVRQQYDYSCGSAALATLLHHHYDMPVGEAEIFKAMYAVGDQPRIRKVGFSLLDIKKYLAGRGFQADGYRATYEQLAAAKRPAIAVITVADYRHFVVIKGARNGKILVGDPAMGLKTYSREEFMAVWNGIIFAIHDSPRVDVTYNKAEEWQPWAVAPLGTALSDDSLSSFTRELPSVYQVSPVLLSPVPRL